MGRGDVDDSGFGSCGGWVIKWVPLGFREKVTGTWQTKTNLGKKCAVNEGPLDHS